MDRSNQGPKTLTRTSIAVVALILLSGVATACSVAVVPVFEVETPSVSNCEFSVYADEIDESADVLNVIREEAYSWADCSTLQVTDDEKVMLHGVISERATSEYDAPFRRTWIRKQSWSEYQLFRLETFLVNANTCDCHLRTDIERRNGWTIYYGGTNCPWGPSCAPSPPGTCSLTYLLGGLGLIAVISFAYPRYR